MTLLHLEPLPPRTTKGDILKFLCSAGGLRREQVGRIDLRGALAVVEVPDEAEAQLVKAQMGRHSKNAGCELGQRVPPLPRTMRPITFSAWLAS